MSRQEWLEQRRTGLTGTDAGAILGLNPYRTAIMVWQDKKGMLPDKPDNEAMRQGRDFEQYVADRFAEATGKEVTSLMENMGNKDYPWAIANPDRWVVAENAGLECKFTADLGGKLRNGQYPLYWYTQCLHYMAVTGAEHWYLAALIATKEFKWWKIERDENEIKALMEFEKNFFEEYMLKNVMPPSDGNSVSTKSIVQTLIGSDVNSNTAEMPELLDLCRRYKEIEDLGKQYEHELEEIKQKIMLTMKEVQKAEVGGEFKVSFKTQQRKSFDSKKFQEKYTDIAKDEELWRITSIRPLKISPL